MSPLTVRKVFLGERAWHILARAARPCPPVEYVGEMITQAAGLVETRNALGAEEMHC